jgi:molybdopterin-guanine dinucleotide biosynthesis protein MobB
VVKVIQVAGLSGSGKTTFIRALIPLLARLGPVGTVKHIGHHAMKIPEGKDTTVMLEAGAEAVAGIDQEKTIITLKNASLADALDTLAGRGIAFAVVEGYKSGPLPKIAIGDVDVEACILRNPEPEEVIRTLDRFPAYFTLAGILQEPREAGGVDKKSVNLAASIVLHPAERGEVNFSDLRRDLTRITQSVQDLSGIITARVVIQQGALFGRSDELLIAVAGENGDIAAAALFQIFSRSRKLLETLGIDFN